MPPTLNPVVTKPNTLPLAPGGVTARTIMSRDGATRPEKKPASANSPAVTTSGGSSCGISGRDQRDQDEAAATTW